MTTVVNHTVTDPETGPVVGAQVIVDVFPDGPGYVNSLDSTVIAPKKKKTDATGLVSFDLVANADIIPAGTVYRVRDYPMKGIVRTHYITVPGAGGPYWLGDILSDPPGTLPSSALSDHLIDTAPHVPANFLSRHQVELRGSAGPLVLTTSFQSNLFDTIYLDTDGFTTPDPSLEQLTIPIGLGGNYLISWFVRVGTTGVPDDPLDVCSTRVLLIPGGPADFIFDAAVPVDALIQCAGMTGPIILAEGAIVSFQVKTNSPNTLTILRQMLSLVKI